MRTLPDHVYQPMAEAWASYRRDVVPKAASTVQVLECRRAFYAGANLLAIILKGLEHVPEDARTACAATIQAELHTFMATVGTTLEGKV